VLAAAWPLIAATTLELRQQGFAVRSFSIDCIRSGHGGRPSELAAVLTVLTDR
jgi:hypothetical protein